ncbi:MAG: hypothetical protein ABH840_03665 [Nanoarchaeota archaeon]
MVKNNKLINGKRGQIMGMPYSVFFSIILILCFMVAAFIAIKIFWCPWCEDCTLSDSGMTGLFKDDLKTTIDDVWNSAGGDRPFKVQLPDKTDYVCFFDDSKAGIGEFSAFENDFKKMGGGNVYLQPARTACEGFKYFVLRHIDIAETTKTENPLCIENNQEMWIKSEHGGPVQIYKK